jgi:hypothetical protein
MWGVPMTALVKRGYGLGLISEASYPRSHAKLNRAAYRAHEPAEPTLERPQTRSTFVEAARQEGVVERALLALGWPTPLLQDLAD